MPFTERDLRAMLEANSADPPPTDDLAAAARTRGRRIRRRRAAAGTVATAALVALGFAVVPSLLPDDEPGRDVMAVATDRPTAAGGRPDVDLSSLPKESTPQAFSDGLGDFLVTDPPVAAPTDVVVNTEDGSIVYEGAGSLSSRSIVGTVEDFSLAEAVSPAKKRAVLLKVRLGAQIDHPSRLEKRGLREGEAVTLWLGLSDTRDDPTGPLRQAVPKGTRVVAFEHVLPPPMGSSKEIRYIQSVVFEDADGTPVAGPYSQDPPTEGWKDAKSFDAVLELVGSLVYRCATVDLTGSGRTLSEEIAENRTLRKEECLRVRTPDPAAPRPTP